MRNVSNGQLEIAVKNSTSEHEVLDKLGKAKNGNTYKSLRRQMNRAGIDGSHLSSSNASKVTKWKRVLKSCPICKELFETLSGHPREKTTCSMSCSNRLLPRGSAGKRTSYRSVCFDTHGKRCLICGEDKIVEVHHWDHDNKNNDSENLMPVCPTHHKYLHSRYRDLIVFTIEQYRMRRNCTAPVVSETTMLLSQPASV